MIFTLYTLMCLIESASISTTIGPPSATTTLNFDYPEDYVSTSASTPDSESPVDDYMVLGAICASSVIFVLAFACGAFCLGCGHLSCGFSINRYEPL